MPTHTSAGVVSKPCFPANAKLRRWSAAARGYEVTTMYELRIGDVVECVLPPGMPGAGQRGNCSVYYYHNARKPYNGFKMVNVHYK